jgi:putative serine protease PepD
MSDHTHRYPSSDDTRPIPPYAGGTATTERTDPLPPYPGPTEPRTDSGGRPRARTAGLLVGALLLGGVGGVLGAAGYDAAVEDEPAPATEPATATGAREPLTPSTADREEDSDAATEGAPSSTIEAVAQEVLPSVVKLNVTGPSGSGSGSGVIISEDGEILTNDHVVSVAADGGEIAVSFNDGSRASATILGTDPVTDLAVVQAEDVSGLTAAAIGDSDAVGVGEEVVAIGSPFGLEATVTSGIVSSLNRPVTVSGASADGQQSTIYPAIQTDAAINPGNSGGPLVNLSGEVVGINSSIRSSSSALGGEGGSIGLGFAIPISKVLPIVEQLRNGETATHARLGVTVANQAGEVGLVDGAAIEDIESGSAAEEAGLEPGDVVTRVDDEQITNVDALVATIRGYRPDDKVTLTVLRGDEELTLEATLDSDEGAIAP